ncbi:MAG TPA: M1 family metallopeptidase [Lunatimonas sp.]|nr:M1 family metallopeptidase [Lunatimonas sp.]
MRYSFYFYSLFAINFSLLFSCKNAEITTQPEPIIESVGGSEALELIVRNTPDSLMRLKEAAMEGYRPSRERKFDLIHTSLDLSFDFETNQVNGSALLLLKPYFYEQEILELDAKDFEITDIWLDESGETSPLNFSYTPKRVTIYLPRTYTSADSLRVGIKYVAKPDETTVPGGTAITDTKGLYFINPSGAEDKPIQIWTQGETEFSSKWFPTIDSPNERQTHDFKLRVPERFISLSNGKLVDQQQNDDGTRTDHWVMDIPHAPYLSALAIGEFAEIKDSWRDLAVNYYVEEKYAEGAKTVFQHTPEMIGFFSEILGVDYPWQKYDQVVVRDFVSGAMENTTVSIFMEALNLDEREALDSEWDYIIAHELFHQWFGNLVTTESWSNLPLNEAFADYSEYLWFEYKEGKDKADKHHLDAMEQYFYESQEKQVDLIRFQYEDKEDMFDSHSYAKGGRILHMLRKSVGDAAFFAALKHYLEANAFGSVEVHNLRLAFEHVTGRDMNWFFNQWFMGSGHPVLAIDIDDSDPDRQLFTVRQLQDLTNTPLYKLPVKVAVYKAGRREEKTYWVDRGVQQFALENGAGTDLVLVDEYMELLAERQTERGMDRLISQFQHAQSGIARLEALDSLTAVFADTQNWATTITKAMGDSFHEVRGLALSRIPQLMSKEEVGSEMEEMLVKMAENDPNNEVRSSAIALLGTLSGTKYAPLIARMIEEPSYVVAGGAMTAVMDMEGEEAQKNEIFERFKGERNIRMVVPLADYLTQVQDSTQSDWFHEKLGLLTGESLYYFIGYYGDYFASVGGTGREEAIERLMRLAEDHPANYVRLTAFQSIFGFIDEGNILERVIKINQTEPDELVKTYQEFFLEPYLEEN